MFFFFFFTGETKLESIGKYRNISLWYSPSVVLLSMYVYTLNARKIFFRVWVELGWGKIEEKTWEYLKDCSLWLPHLSSTMLIAFAYYLICCWLTKEFEIECWNPARLERGWKPLSIFNGFISDPAGLRSSRTYSHCI